MTKADSRTDPPGWNIWKS